MANIIDDKAFEKTGNQGRKLPLPQKEMQELFLIALLKCNGNISRTARMIDIHLQTVYKWKEKSESFAQAVEELRTLAMEQRLDSAENTIDMLIDTGDGPTARWFLDKQGQSRGYGRTEKPDSGIKIAMPVYGDMHVNTYPPIPETIEQWETQVEDSKKRALLEASKSGDI
jgi:hypothetical protein